MKKTILEMVKIIKEESPEKFKAIDDKIMARVIRGLFKSLNTELTKNEEKLKIVGLGNFRTFNREVNGKKIKKIIFRPAKAKEK